jgi:chromate transporter
MSGRKSNLAEVALVFLRLGLTSFGGPVAHLGYFHNEVVRRRKWIDEVEYADLVALCQFLPGPASSQVVFALGQRRGGFAGALTASFCFTLPSALLMIGFAYGVISVASLRTAGWLHGLKLAAVAVVAQAVWTMGRKLCPDLQRMVLALLAALAVAWTQSASVQIEAIAVGGALGWIFYREKLPQNAPVAGARPTRAHVWAAITVGIFAALLVLLPVAAKLTENKEIRVVDGFYRSGALVFGGGHVVLPLLRAEVIPPGWINQDQFLAGYGMAQAIPGPLFTFAAYLGTMIKGPPHAWLGGVLGVLAIFLPAWLLIGGALPFWNFLRSKSGAQAALRGANAAVVGVLLAALYNPVWTEGVTKRGDLVAVSIAFVLLQFARIPSWAIVMALAAAANWFG